MTGSLVKGENDLKGLIVIYKPDANVNNLANALVIMGALSAQYRQKKQKKRELKLFYR